MKWTTPRTILVVTIVIIAISLWQGRSRDQHVTTAGSHQATSTEARAYFAGGCFWSMGSAFTHVPGVIDVVTGYMGGHLDHPTYRDINTETTGHRETVMVIYDPTKVNYEALVIYYFSHVDPTDSGGAFVDRGESYTSAIFYQTEQEHEAITKEVERIRVGYASPIVTAIEHNATFWPAEDYHQHYPEKNPTQYALYRAGSGRDARIAELCALRSAHGVPCVTEHDIEGMLKFAPIDRANVPEITHASLSRESDPQWSGQISTTTMNTR